jgi:uncharacterized protein YkwD
MAHELVQQERVARRLKPFKRSHELDSLAFLHVRDMGDSEKVFHSVQSLDELKDKLSSDKYVGENVKRGLDIKDMHLNTMGAEYDWPRANILSKKFTEMGCAVAKDAEGKIYVCHLFRKGHKRRPRGRPGVLLLHPHTQHTISQ